MTLLKVPETRIPAMGSEDDLESERFGEYYQVRITSSVIPLSSLYTENYHKNSPNPRFLSPELSMSEGVRRVVFHCDLPGPPCPVLESMAVASELAGPNSKELCPIPWWVEGLG